MVKELQRKWESKYPPEISTNIEYPKRTLQSFLKQTAEEYPNHKALYFYGKEWTYLELYEESVTFAGQLQDLGVKKGDRVAIMLPNTPQSVISYYGTLLAGAVVVQTNPLYMERELLHQMTDSGAKVMICLDLLYPRVMKVKEETQLEHIVVTKIKDCLPFPKNVLYPLTQRKSAKVKVDISYNHFIHSFSSLLKKGSFKEIEDEVDPVEDLALLQYTGGTTGLAKGVMLSHYNLVANTTQCLSWMYQMEKGKEKTLAVLPFFHVYGMTVSMNLSVMNGSQMVILPKFDPKEVLQMIQKHKITTFPGAPTMYISLLNHPDLEKFDLSSIKACISGSSPLPVEVQHQFESVTGGKLVEGFGLTESSPVTHCNLIWGERKEGSIGLPWPNTDAAILSQESEDFGEPGEIGELIIRGPQVMKGYWNRPEETAATFFDEWLKTGDMGYMDEEGFFYIVDRKKDMIIASGFNIYPREIEEVLYEHHAVQEAVVIGVPDPYRGETVKAFIVTKEGMTLTEGELNKYCRENLASYKVPKIYEFRSELPKTMVGKVLRRVLVEEEKEKRAQAKEKSHQKTS
ncbi:long-chain-fatty-acid--CoA ligase [Bacillus sp. FJAT-44742]|uniref:long-chain-fatty-acid--CoA ligase n=1 Tax=Bacillus sp. FJAT-44742 TaxID=2014005 RepID=UPI000C234243|nr:long-chain-fatty-acid--CoA ligase [Bacillus sp. FJAT-44742]